MIAKPLDQITAVDLEELRTNGVRESRTLEYKRELAFSTRDERKEFLGDVTALANTAGGDIIFGVAEASGEPTAFPGIEIRDWDELERQLASAIRDGTEPRLQNLSFHRIPVDAGRYVLIIRAQRSYRRPHRVVFSGHGHFYGRDSSQKYRYDVEDIRRAFTLMAAASETFERHRRERVEAIRAGAGYAPLSHDALAILHLIPENAFHLDQDLDLTGLNTSKLRPLPRAALGYSPGVNLDGHYSYNEWGYAHVARNGIIEAVEGLITRDGVTYPTELELDITEASPSYLSLLRDLAVEPPVHSLLTLTGLAGHYFPTCGLDFLRRQPVAQGAEVLELRGPALESLDVDVPLALRPLFDRFWNAFGYEQCLDYDEAGGWSPRR